MDTNGMMTISEVTKEYDVSTRMLRYYDEIGLLKSERMENYAYRVYDAAAVRRLQQILTLRKLRIPLKKIAEIFESAEQAKIVEVFEESISELDGEIEAMQTIRGILEAFVARLNKAANLNVELGLLRDAEMMNVINTLCPSKNSLKDMGMLPRKMTKA